MILQQDEDAYQYMVDKFNLLIWRRVHDAYQTQSPYGIVAMDLFQEGFTGLHESIFAFREDRLVGFAYYVDLRIGMSIRSVLRRTRALSYRLLDTSISFDFMIAEDDTLSLHNVLTLDKFQHNPEKMALYQEVKQRVDRVLMSFSLQEQIVYRLQESGYSYQEVARMTGLPLKSIDNVIQKIRRKTTKLYR